MYKLPFSLRGTWSLCAVTCPLCRGHAAGPWPRGAPSQRVALPVRAGLPGTEQPAVLCSGEPWALPPERGSGLQSTSLRQRGPHSPLSVAGDRRLAVAHFPGIFTRQDFQRLSALGGGAPRTPAAAPRQHTWPPGPRVEPSSREPPACPQRPGALTAGPFLSCRFWDSRLMR